MAKVKKLPARKAETKSTVKSKAAKVYGFGALVVSCIEGFGDICPYGKDSWEYEIYMTSGRVLSVWSYSRAALTTHRKRKVKELEAAIQGE